MVFLFLILGSDHLRICDFAAGLEGMFGVCITRVVESWTVTLQPLREAVGRDAGQALRESLVGWRPGLGSYLVLFQGSVAGLTRDRYITIDRPSRCGIRGAAKHARSIQSGRGPGKGNSCPNQGSGRAKTSTTSSPSPSHPSPLSAFCSVRARKTATLQRKAMSVRWHSCNIPKGCGFQRLARATY